jgi:anthranilate synthase component II
MKVLIVDNFDSFTYNLAQMVERTNGCAPVILKNDSAEYDISGFDKIIFSPGPGIPSEEAGLMKRTIRDFSKTKSILGICLGHQAIAEFYGARLINLDTVYHGIKADVRITGSSDVLFSRMPNTISGGLYHSWGVSGDDFPECLTITAVSNEGIIMGIAHKTYNIKGLQFHPESIMTELGENILRNWLSF